MSYSNFHPNLLEGDLSYGYRLFIDLMTRADVAAAAVIFFWIVIVMCHQKLSLMFGSKFRE